MHIDVSNDVGGDIDRVETSEWLEALDAVVVHDGADRARDLLARVVERAQHAGTGPIGSLNTPYVNTIPLEREAQLPGDPANLDCHGSTLAGPERPCRGASVSV